MKQNLLLLLSLLLSTIAIAQTTWTGSGANTNWNNIDNWDTNQVPTALDDVVIPTGFTVTLNVPGNVKSIDLQGTSVFDINTNLTFSEPSTFGVNSTANWNGGTLNSTGNILTNLGTITINNTNVTLAPASTLTNNGDINFIGTGDIFISANAVLNNGLTGIIDFQTDDSGISETGAGVNLLNNSGLIKTSFSTADPTDKAFIGVEFKNNDGTIQVEVGVLNLSNTSQDSIELTDGVYNVFADSALDFDNSVTLSGTLTGVLTGDLNWRSNVYVNSPNTATFNFTGNATVSWVSGNLIGGGTLVNESIITTLTNNVFINDATTLTNNDTVNFTGVADIFIGADSVFNNTASGVIDFQADDSGISETGLGVNLLNNSGLIKTSFSTENPTDQATISVEFKNNDGTLQVEVGILNLSNPTQDSIELTDGVYNVFADAALDFDSSITLSGTLTGTLTGDLNWRSNVYVNSPNTATFNFSDNETVSWVGGSLLGGGTLINESTINTLATNVFIIGVTTLTNNSNISLIGVADIFIGADSVLDNTASGIIDFQADNSGISETGSGVNLLNNFGLIKTSFITADPTDQATINVELKNNDGTLQVEVGTLNLSNPTQNSIELTDGVYNVFADAALDFDSSITLSGTLTGTLTGDLNWRSNVYVNSPNTATFNFSGNETVSWVDGSLVGGGTLINESTINTLAANIFINGATTLTNNSKINLIGVGDIFINTDSVLNNTATGIIDFQADNSGISETGGGDNLLNNFGLIKTSFSSADPSDQATISVELKNNDGTLQVEVGTLNLSNSSINSIELTDGEYNVFADAALDFDSSITLSGTLTGTLIGDLNWRSNVYVNSLNTATFNFSGTDAVSWVSGSLLGGGTLVNESKINTFSTNVIINGATTLTNNYNINLTGTGDIFIGADSVLENSATGIIDFQADNSGISETGGGVNLLNNSGLIVSSSLTTTVFIGCEVTNTGIINAASGTINFTGTLDHQSSGIIKGIANINLPPITNLTNNGTFSPGASPGTLAVIGNYTSTANTVLDIELNGLTPDTEHDVLAINGTSVVFEGTVDVTMGFEAEIGDEFTIATTTGSITTANLQTPIENVDFDGKRYTFDISYPDDNKVVLTITDKLDILPPNVVTQDITVQLDNTGNVSIVPSDIDNGSTDNCSLLNELIFSLDIDSFTCVDLGDNTVNLTVTDIEGNFASAPAIVTVEDNVLPIVLTQDITVQLDASGTGSIEAAAIDDGSSDNCGIASLSVDVSDFDCSDVGVNTVTLTVTDIAGNSNTATAMVTIEDNILPIVVTQGITVQLDGSGSASVVAADLDDGSSDNCGIASLSIDNSTFDCSNVGANTVTLTVTDVNGNTNTDTAIVTVEDSVLPMVVTQDITIQLDGSGSASTLAADIDDGSSDNCGIASLSLDVSDFDCSDVGANTVTLTVTDVNGNSNTGTAIVTVEDDLDPVVVTQDIIVQLDGSGNASITPAMIDDGSTDNCGIAGSSLDITSFTTDDLGPNTVTLTVTDINGNFSSATAIVTVEAGTDLVTAIAQDITVQLDTNGEATITAADVDDGSSVVSGTLNLSIDVTEFDCSDLGPNTVTLTVSDGNGNSANAIAVVTVEDNILPTVVIQDITVQLDTSGNASITPAMIDNGSSDNCGIASMTLDVTDFDCSDIGTNTVTLTVTDINGNSNTGTAIVTVQDKVNPVAVTQDITVQLDGSGSASILAADVDNGSTDNCGIDSYSLDVTMFDCDDLGANIVSLTVTDGSGNSNTETATVTVEDNIDPTVSTQDVTIQLNSLGLASVTTTMVDNGSFDNCNIVSISLDQMNFDSGDLGANTVTLTVEDQSGNTASDTAVVTVQEAQTATFAFQEVFTLPNAAVFGSVVFNDVDGDNDQDMVLSGAALINQFGGPNGGQVSRLYTNDGMGNFSQIQSNKTQFLGLSYSSADFADINNDGTLDFISAGENHNTGTNYVKYYANYGSYNFTEVSGIPFPNIERVDFKIADFDADGVNDILMIGLLPAGSPANARLFENQGTATNPSYANRFSSINPLPRVSNGSIDVADIDGDNDLDIFVSGQMTNGTKIARLYRNNGNFQFSQVMGTSFDHVDSGDSDFADVDDDGDQDLLISGLDSSNNNVLKLYLNDGTGVFTEVADAITIPSSFLLQAFEFADVDGDTDKDVLLSGYNPSNSNKITTLWENTLYSPSVALRGENSTRLEMDFEEEQPNFGVGFKVIPNPTNLGYTNILMPDVKGEVTVTVSDVFGRIVSTKIQTVNSNQIRINTYDFSSGVYVISLKKGKSTFTAKLIVE